MRLLDYLSNFTDLIALTNILLTSLLLLVCLIFIIPLIPLLLVYTDWIYSMKWNELVHVKTNKMACVHSEDSDQPGHPPSLIGVFALR